MLQQIKEKKHGLHVFILLELEYITYKVSMVAVSGYSERPLVKNRLTF